LLQTIGRVSPKTGLGPRLDRLFVIACFGGHFQPGCLSRPAAVGILRCRHLGARGFRKGLERRGFLLRVSRTLLIIGGFGGFSIPSKYPLKTGNKSTTRGRSRRFRIALCLFFPFDIIKLLWIWWRLPADLLRGKSLLFRRTGGGRFFPWCGLRPPTQGFLFS
jgi:hypothetical protein